MSINEKIREWKEKYKTIYSVKIGGQEYIYRTLNIGECILALSYLQTNELKAQEIAFQCVLYPENFNPDDLPVIPSESLFKCILESSKIFDPDGISNLVEQAHNNLDSQFNINLFQWKVTIMNIFPSYKMSDLDKLSPQEFFDLLILAEKVTGKELLDYKAIKNFQKTKTEQNKIKDFNEIDYDLIASGKKFLSKEELDRIAADNATQLLREHYLAHKIKKGK